MKTRSRFSRSIPKYLVMAGKLVAVGAVAFAVLGLSGAFRPGDAWTRFAPSLTLVLAVVGIGLVRMGKAIQNKGDSGV